MVLLQRMEVEGAQSCDVEVLGAALRPGAKYMMNRIEDKVGWGVCGCVCVGGGMQTIWGPSFGHWVGVVAMLSEGRLPAAPTMC